MTKKIYGSPDTDQKTNSLFFIQAPHGRTPYLLKKTKEDRILAAKLYENPIDTINGFTQEGHDLYTHNCAICHGDNGDGKGYLFVSNKYPLPPSNLLDTKIDTMPDGELFHVLSVGFNLMKGQASQLEPQERWTIINYVKYLNTQSKKNR